MPSITSSWNDGTEDGKFTITNVRPGVNTPYTRLLMACWESLGKANVTVEAGKTLELSNLEWKPLRYGKQVWEIGYSAVRGTNSSRGMAKTIALGLGTALSVAFERHHLHHPGKSDCWNWFLSANAARNVQGS